MMMGNAKFPRVSIINNKASHNKLSKTMMKEAIIERRELEAIQFHLEIQKTQKKM